MWPPLVSMKTPRPASFSEPTSVASSSSSASREGIGFPPEPLCAGEVLLAKPTAPARIASSTSFFICATSPGVAARSVASSPIT